MNKKTALLIIVSILIVIALAFAITFFLLQDKPIDNGGIPGDTNVPSSRPPTTKPDTTNPGVGTTTDTSTPPTSEQLAAIPDVPRLRQITTSPVAGSVLYPVALKSGKTTINKSGIRFMERATGHVYQTEKDSLVLTRLTSTRIPKVYEAKWIKDGSAVYARYLNDDSDAVETFYGEIKAAPQFATSTTDLSNDIQFAPGELRGSFMAKQIADLTTAPHKKAFFQLTTVGNGGSGGAVGNTARSDGSQKKEIFSSPLSEWVSSWVSPNIIALQTKASSNALGVLYYLNPETFALSRTIDGIGLVAQANRDGSLVMTSETAGQGIYSSVFNVKTGYRTAVPETLADKCVWGKKDKKLLICAVPTSIPAARYPDAWYQGTVSFKDAILAINTETGLGTTIIDLYGASLETIDAVELDINESDDYITFINRIDGSLWGLFLAD